ncbi:hypothetical protein B0T26DRAFT_747875 [Lasiosphaeria miniovina]|uniref:Uncharacterized protein n=1 Tax=Lasiosphaeria miniovina TaxID=1954250 RepID=A0AA40B4I3_9PEZI|nr:uncharacterized protein B0T26DRAFT_747875 [Lasiosphaeria miniovina]KAK0727559.1 hypothetical protein B0T26DRAFT_747875 [Lasiosphaeria miniovina]
MIVGGSSANTDGMNQSPVPSAAILNAGTTNGIIISAAAEKYPQTRESTKTCDNGEDKPRKHKKIKANNELEAGKNKWIVVGGPSRRTAWGRKWKQETKPLAIDRLPSQGAS